MRRDAILYIEGTAENKNGNLETAFKQLLEQTGCKWSMPILKLSGGVSQAAGKFLADTIHRHKLLLVDLDNPKAYRATRIEELKLTQWKQAVSFMIQEMEGWFFSQPEVLKLYYDQEPVFVDSLDAVLQKQSWQEIASPADVLRQITSDTTKGRYHKVRDGAKLLSRMDSQQLLVADTELATLVARILGLT